MAFQLPRIDFTDAKVRIFLMAAGFIGFIAIVYLGVHLFSKPTGAVGVSHVAGAPGGLRSVPGGQLTPEYYRALIQANAQAAKQAQISGGSAVPTLLNEPGAQPAFQPPASAANCTIVCPTEENVNVKNDIDDLVKAGKMSAVDGKQLTALADKNVAVSEYAAQLDQLVKAGKLSPEQARKILSDYKKQHENTLLQDSGKVMDMLVRSGKMSLDTANDLLGLQKKRVTPAEYAVALKQMVKDGKISSATAGQLLGQYTQQQAKESGVESIGQLSEMATRGEITPDVAKELADYQARGVSQKEYEEEVQHLVKQGKLTPEQAQRLLAQYRQQISPAVAEDLANDQRRNVPLDDYQAKLRTLVASGKLSPEQALQLLENYRQVKAEPITGGVLEKVASQESQPKTTTAVVPPLDIPNVQGAEAFAQLQKRMRTTGPTTASVTTPEQFGLAASKVQAEAERQEKERLQAIMNGMSQQAGQLISSWQPPSMSGQMKSEVAAKKGENLSSSSSTLGLSKAGNSPARSLSAPMVKAGTIYYAVLDTGVNSDYPDDPVMATVVDGPYKGAKLLGKLAMSKGQDRITLTFKLMNMDDWASGKTINAFAIDPDTARTALASSVDNHYFVRYGSLFASSFITGYASAISSSGATTSTGIFGTTTTHPALSVGEKVMTGLGQVGTTLGTSIQNYTSTPPTVTIDPGVSLGILFMADVSG